MLNLQRVTMFIAVVDAGSFTLAAAALGQTKAVVSFNVRQLENDLTMIPARSMLMKWSM